MNFSFKEYLELQEMAARKSLSRNLEKWMEGIDKPVAILTAFRGSLDLEANLVRNKELVNDLTAAGMSHYPVTGSGQEIKKWLGMIKVVEPTREESFVVQPREGMNETAFIAEIKKLMGKYEQDFVAMKLPSSGDAFLLGRDGSSISIGQSAHPRREDDPFFTELLKGVRTPQEQQSGWERTGEMNPIKRFINWLRGRSSINLPV